MEKNRSELYGGGVWILSGIALLIYGYLGLTQTNIPGVEEFVDFVQSAEGGYIYLAAFLAIFLEGLYFVGSFFPGSTFVLLIAIVAQTGGIQLFLSIIFTIFIGWNVAGIVNILLARFFSKNLLRETTAKKELVDNTEMTWFPAFRANTEVAQITEGHSPVTVFFSSLRVKAITSIGLIVYALVIPFIIDINELDNEEGFTGLFVIALVSIGVGIYKIHQHKKEPVEESNSSVSEDES